MSGLRVVAALALLSLHLQRVGEATAAASMAAHHAVAITGQRPAVEQRVEVIGAAAVEEAAVLLTGMPQDPALGEDYANPARFNQLELRKDSIDWLDDNPNNQDESSRNIHIVHSNSDDEDVESAQIHMLGVDHSHPEPQFLEFDEPSVFENPHPQQTPEVNKMNDDLLVIFESLVLVRGTIHRLMCRVPVANDRQSLGKEVGGEARKADKLLKDAIDKSQAVQAKGGLPVPIPPHFYAGVKPVRVRQ